MQLPLIKDRYRLVKTLPGHNGNQVTDDFDHLVWSEPQVLTYWRKYYNHLNSLDDGPVDVVEERDGYMAVIESKGGEQLMVRTPTIEDATMIAEVMRGKPSDMLGRLTLMGYQVHWRGSPK